MGTERERQDGRAVSQAAPTRAAANAPAAASGARVDALRARVGAPAEAPSLWQRLRSGASGVVDDARYLANEARQSSTVQTAGRAINTVASLPHTVSQGISRATQAVDRAITRGEHGIQDRLDGSANAATGFVRRHAGQTAGNVADAVTHATADLAGGVAGIAGGVLHVANDTAGLAARASIDPGGTGREMAGGIGHLGAGAANLYEHTAAGAPLRALHVGGQTLLQGGSLRQSASAGVRAGADILDPNSAEMRRHNARLAGAASRAGTAIMNARAVDIGDVTGQIVGNLAMGAVGGESSAARTAATAGERGAVVGGEQAAVAAAERAVTAEGAVGARAATTDAVAGARAATADAAGAARTATAEASGAASEVAGARGATVAEAPAATATRQAPVRGPNRTLEMPAIREPIRPGEAPRPGWEAPREAPRSPEYRGGPAENTPRVRAQDREWGGWVDAAGNPAPPLSTNDAIDNMVRAFGHMHPETRTAIEAGTMVRGGPAVRAGAVPPQAAVPARGGLARTGEYGADIAADTLRTGPPTAVGEGLATDTLRTAASDTLRTGAPSAVGEGLASDTLRTGASDTLRTGAPTGASRAGTGTLVPEGTVGARTGTGTLVPEGTVTPAARTGTGTLVPEGTVNPAARTGTGTLVPEGTVNPAARTGTGTLVPEGTVAATEAAGSGTLVPRRAAVPAERPPLQPGMVEDDVARLPAGATARRSDYVAAQMAHAELGATPNGQRLLARSRENGIGVRVIRDADVAALTPAEVASGTARRYRPGSAWMRDERAIQLHSSHARDPRVLAHETTHALDPEGIVNPLRATQAEYTEGALAREGRAMAAEQTYMAESQGAEAWTNARRARIDEIRSSGAADAEAQIGRNSDLVHQRAYDQAADAARSAHPEWTPAQVDQHANAAATQALGEMYGGLTPSTEFVNGRPRPGALNGRQYYNRRWWDARSRPGAPIGHQRVVRLGE